MARQARIKYDFGIFHIQQTGGGCRKLFISREDRLKFLSIINRNQKKFNFVLHGYCLIEDDSYDIILDVNGGDLSKIMKSVNITYAMYAKCEGKLFADRYKSMYLDDATKLAQAKEKLSLQRTKIIENEVFNQCFETLIANKLTDIDLEDCNDCIQCMETAKVKLNQIASKKGVSTEALLSDKEQRNRLILNFRKGSTLSLKSIGDLFGGLSESSVSKIIKTTEL